MKLEFTEWLEWIASKPQGFSCVKVEVLGLQARTISLAFLYRFRQIEFRSISSHSEHFTDCTISPNCEEIVFKISLFF